MRTLAGNHRLPDNPTWIEFTKTDGSESRWPTNTKEIVDRESIVNFYKPCALDDSITISWRKTVGMEVAKKLNMLAGPFYVLKDWPKGYRLYDHHKGPQESPRHDPYLYGSNNTAKFRSPAEFIPHAFWLLSDNEGNDVQCECKYCSKRPQRAISFELGLSQTRSTQQKGTHTARRPREKKSSLATIRRVSSPVMPPKGPSQFSVPERENDLRAISGSNRKAGRRWARLGEIVWCALNRPIKCNSSIDTVSEKSAILFWPALVQDIRLHTEAVMKKGPPQSSDLDIVMANGNNRDMETANLGTDDNSNNNNKDNDDDDVPWKVVQSTLYKVKLLAVLSDCIVPDSRIIPYQAYAPPDELLSELKQMKVAPDDLPIDNENGEGSSDIGSALRNKFAQFQPIPYDSVDDADGEENLFLKAAGPFALAIQIASRLADFFTPTDEWKYSFIAPSTSQARPKGVTQPDVNLEGISGTVPLSPAQLQELKNRVMGLRNREKENSFAFIETRFQGLWWGAERIWMDDLVRLKMGRHQVAPDGAQYIKKPAGLSDMNNDDDTDADLGAAGRGIFMQIEGLFTVDISDDAGTRKECRMCGMLYELADEDWTGEDEYAAPASDGKSSNENSPNNGGENIGSADRIQIPVQTVPTTSNSPKTSLRTSTNAVASSSSTSITLPSTLPSMPVTPFRPTILGSSSQPNISLNQALAQASNQQPHVDKPHNSENSPAKKRSLSGPPQYFEPFPLPPPPKGYKFHPILPPTHEAVLALELLSGRYYPKILEHPLVIDRVTAAIESGQLSQNSPLWALECLTPGVHNAVDPHKWKGSRLAMIKDADATAEREIAEFWRGKILQSIQESNETSQENQMIVYEVEQNQLNIAT